MSRPLTRYAVIAGLLLVALALAGCGTATQEVPQTQAAGTTVYQIQVLPFVSENARPVHSDPAGAEPDREVANGNGRATWTNNQVTVTVTTDSQTADTAQRGEARDASATPTTDVSPEIDANLTPGSG